MSNNKGWFKRTVKAIKNAIIAAAKAVWKFLKFLGKGIAWGTCNFVNDVMFVVKFLWPGNWKKENAEGVKSAYTLRRELNRLRFSNEYDCDDFEDEDYDSDESDEYESDDHDCYDVDEIEEVSDDTAEEVVSEKTTEETTEESVENATGDEATETTEEHIETNMDEDVASEEITETAEESTESSENTAGDDKNAIEFPGNARFPLTDEQKEEIDTRYLQFFPREAVDVLKLEDNKCYGQFKGQSDKLTYLAIFLIGMPLTKIDAYLNERYPLKRDRYNHIAWDVDGQFVIVKDIWTSEVCRRNNTNFTDAIEGATTYLLEGVTVREGHNGYDDKYKIIGIDIKSKTWDSTMGPMFACVGRDDIRTIIMCGRGTNYRYVHKSTKGNVSKHTSMKTYIDVPLTFIKFPLDEELGDKLDVNDRINHIDKSNVRPDSSAETVRHISEEQENREKSNL